MLELLHFYLNSYYINTGDNNNTCLHLVHRPGHIDLEQSWGKPFLLNNFKATNTNPHSNHLATLN